MPVIIVHKPFRLREVEGGPAKLFEPGRHTVTKKQLEHWFVKACIADGRAVLAAEKSEKPAGDKV